jgi:subtilisin family serine protease
VVAAAALATAVASSDASAASATATYLVVYKEKSSTGSAGSAVTAAGGQLVATYAPISVVVARSSNPDFAVRMRAVKGVEGAVATTRFASAVDGGAVSTDAADTTTAGPSAASAGLNDSLSGLQWDMAQIHTPEAHAITGGSPDVLVGDIDTGLDYTHPDLAANVDDAASANCVGGAAVQGKVAAMDDNGHGTHTAGTIAAAANGIGIVGVAPNVRIAGIKAGNADGFFFPEAVVCAFMWAGDHGIDVTNNSYFADPYLFNCKNDPTQRAIWQAEQRAIQYAESKGVTVVAADGNQSEDINNPTRDQTSPDDTTPVDRPVNKNCIIIPVQIPGVIGVSADGNNLQDGGGYLKSFYSSFGKPDTAVVAPGGDSIFGTNAASPNGRVLSTWPASLLTATCLPARRVVDASGATYCYQQGTSMASPHAAGVAALILSRLGKAKGPADALMRSNQVAAILEHTADAQPCPSSLPTGYDTFLGLDDEMVQTCEGQTNQNSWYGNGQVNALSAVTNGH